MRIGRASSSATAAGILWLVVGVCCALPLGWMAAQVAIHPAILVELRPSAFRMGLLGRTLVYNGAAALAACLLAIPAANVIGRGRGWMATGLLAVLPVALVMPSVGYTYGWLQFFRILGIGFDPGGPADVARCIWTLACWLWPIPAAAVGLSLRQLDSQIQQQAMLDGALHRITARLMVGPMLAAGAIVLVLAMQEFSVYERSGISVIATEVRTVFETGIGSANSPASIAGVVAGGGRLTTDQAQRAAAAVATALPLLLIVAGLVLAVMWCSRRSAADNAVDSPNWPSVLNAGWRSISLAALVLAVTLAIPAASLVASISSSRWRIDPLGHSMPVRVWLWAEPYAMGSLFYGLLAGTGGLSLAILASVRRSRALLILAIAAFLIGGELLAIADIHLFNRIGGGYGNVPMVVMAYIGRFGWLALLVGGFTWSKSFSDLRDVAAVDGAGPWRTALRVVGPIAWPILVAGAVLVTILSMTEVSATVLLQPARPQTLIVVLMSWLHILRYDDMLEGTLLLMAMVLGLAIVCVGLIFFGGRLVRRIGRSAAMLAIVCMAVFALSCKDRTKPVAVWCETGGGPGQLVYPRGIAYSAREDCFFVVDRTARIQRLDSHGKYVLDWRMPKSDSGKPIGLSIGPDGNVYIADTHYSRVMVYSPAGKFIREIGSFGQGSGQFIYPTHVAFDSAGNIYVSEYGDNDRIQVFDPTGSRVIRVIGRFGQGNGEFSRPEAMVIDGEMLYVTDSSNHRIAVFKTDGTFVRSIGGTGSGLGQFRFPYGMVMDGDGNLAVAEFGNNRVQLIDKTTGRGLKTWGSAGREEGQLAYPWDLAVDKRGRVIIVDSGNDRLQIIEW